MAQSWPEAILEFFTLLFKIVYFWFEAVVKFVVPHRYFRKDVRGQKVLITGAGSGLGKLMAYRFMRLGCDLVLWDVNREAIDSMISDMADTVKVKAYTVDLSSREQIYQALLVNSAKAADKVKREVGKIDILVNNAGIVTGKKFLECDDRLIEKTMEVNANAHFWTVKSFLPAMLEANSGHIVSIASSAGLFGVTGLADYCASKFAAVGFDESLRFELAAMGKTGVHTTVVCPYFINTGMFDGVQTRFPSILPIQNQHKAVDRIIDAVLCNQAFLIIPRNLYMAYALRGLFPVKVGQAINEYLGVSQSMDTFVGRAKVASKAD